MKDKSYLEWLSGLIDGEGHFYMTKKGYTGLEIIIDLKDHHCLYRIKHIYGGSIKVLSHSKVVRYRLHHKQGILKLIRDINGNLRNPTRVLEFNKLLLKYGEIDKNIDLGLKDLKYESGWLSGIIDSNGSIYLNNISSQVFISITQKDKYILDIIKNVYGGNIYYNKSNGGSFKWCINKKEDIINLLNNYFKLNPLRTSKNIKINMLNQYYELRKIKAHLVKNITDIRYKQWTNFNQKWNDV